MRKLLQVAWHEFYLTVFKKSFILSLLSVPLVMGLNIGVGQIMERANRDNQPTGVVDEAGVMVPLSVYETWADGGGHSFIRYADEASAEAAAAADEIGGYFLVTADYLQTNQVLSKADKEPSGNVVGAFFDYLQLSIGKDLPPAVVGRLTDGSRVAVRSLDGERTIPVGGPTLELMLPLLAMIPIAGLIIASVGYMTQAVVSEKENRTMELLLTTISSDQLIAGKILGIVAISFVQLCFWVLVLVVWIWGAGATGMAWFQDPVINWEIILGTALVALPTYVLATAVMVAVSSATTSVQDAQQLTPVVIISMFIPAYTAGAIVMNPDGTFAMLLTFLPFMSLLTVAMRNLFSVVPGWQVAAATVAQTIYSVGAIWLASRAFRLGMLRYGQRLTWKSLLRRQSAGERRAA